jgi:TRAP-type C4-dicarboxylate transport system permease small subunit
MRAREQQQMHDIGLKSGILSRRINHWIEAACVILLTLLVLDVWLGILVRYVIPLPLTFTEELARYLMIWMALLAVSSGIVYREHIGVEYVFKRFPAGMRRWLALAFDLLSFTFFFLLLWYGIDFVERGFKRVTMIYGMPKGYPFLGVPLAAGVACIQLILVALQDFCSPQPPDSTGTDTVSIGSPVQER